MAQDFVRDNNLNALPLGTHMIDEGNLWVNIVEKDLKTVDSAKLEVHDQFIDVQIPLTGKESFGIKPRSECKHPDGEMDKKNDILFYADTIENIITVEAGQQIVFEPDTAHAPLIGSGKIKKAIFKVRVC